MSAADDPTIDPELQSSQLGLAVIAEATAVTSRDDALIDAATENLHDTINSLIDEPLTRQQEEVVEVLGAVSGSLTSGLSSALAATQDRPVEDILSKTSQTLLSRQQAARGDDQ